MAKYADQNGLSHAFTIIKNALSNKADSSHTHNGLVPSGGTAGQVLSKSNATDYAIEWANASGDSKTTWYGTSSTTASTATKAVTCSGFALEAGAFVAVRFSTANTYTSGAIKLNVNSTGAKTIYTKSGATSSNNTLTWSAYTTLLFVYSGSYWYYLGSDRDGDNSYTLPTASQSTKGGVMIPSDGSLWMSGDTLMLGLPPFMMFFNGSTIQGTDFATLLGAVTSFSALYVVEALTLADSTTATLAYPCYGTYCEYDGTNGFISFYFDAFDTGAGRVTTFEVFCFDDDTWTVTALGPETMTEQVSITIPSTSAGSNAPNKTATVTTSGYTPVAIAGWTWASGGTRNNWFNFYRMDCDPATGVVTVSVCNTHASSAASGTVLVDVLLKRSDLV